MRLAHDSLDLTFDNADLSRIDRLQGGAGIANALAFNNTSATLFGSKLTGWEAVTIGAGSTISLGEGSDTLATTTLVVTGTLEIGHDHDGDGALTLSGHFLGGGTVVLDANLAAGGSDKLTIEGSVLGAPSRVVVRQIGNLAAGEGHLDRPAEIKGVISAKGVVTATSFTSSIVELGAVAYRFQFDSAAKAYDLIRYFVNECRPEPGTPGAFTCSGTYQIGEPQALSASGVTALSVTVHQETPIDTYGTALTLTQTGGAGGISLTQSATGQVIRGSVGGILAVNADGGAVMIDVSGSVTGRTGEGIVASDGVGGAGVAITAAEVSGAASGITVFGSGTGSVSIAVSGTVTGAYRVWHLC